VPTPEELLEQGTPLPDLGLLPIDPSEARQPDPVTHIGEITDYSDPPAEAKLIDSETSLLFREAESIPETTPDTPIAVDFKMGLITGFQWLVDDPNHPGNRLLWRYAWVEAMIDPTDTNPHYGYTWVTNPDGIDYASLNPGDDWAYAYNTVEQRHIFEGLIPGEVLHGHPIEQVVTGGTIVLKLKPIPIGTPVLLKFEKRTFVYGSPALPDTWMVSFSEPNAVEAIVCPTP
jgi:hypothetical protein